MLNQLGHVVDLYDEEVAFTDAAIGRLIEGIEDLGWTRPTVFVITSDHGEHLRERGRFGHGEDLYRQLLDVPLVVGGDVDENLRGEVVEAPVETRQIGATLLDFARVEYEAIEGASLLRIAQRRARWDEVSFAESTADGGKVAAVSSPWKLILSLRDRSEELYRIDQDPNELANLIRSGSPEAAAKLVELREALGGFQVQKRESAARLELSEEEIEHLRALGYVQ